ncbi:family 78 glycoside hydrolase catalytic domain [Compostimonas suwonensis]|uniref:alpha-L-rhamnosidase n=1 Tax=Compostimonas suwonensis TaxID=1048394 RepID=A0A2M9C3S6_9MICO|nr:family 78 glycoside hydrolase catalytic domain [Compostimonas suwonensis]PJJ65139.1 LPXTG-motif cell wall-anchored protein [Compostimonas suwonensis]
MSPTSSQGARTPLRSRGRALVAALLSLGLVASGAAFASIPANAAEPAPASVSLTDLEVENRTEPLGIDVAKPRFSWVTDTAARDVQQTSYRIRLATDEAQLDAAGVWDSGVVPSDASTAIEYGGPALDSATTYYWRVDVQTTAGDATASSTFGTGLYTDADWADSAWIGRDRLTNTAGIEMTLAGASWIHPPYSGANTPPGYFRKSFTLPADKQIDRAELVMTGDIGFSAHLNGAQVATGRAVADVWKTAKRVQVFPTPGENLLAVRLENTAKAFAAVVGKLTVRFTDGTTQDVVTDTSWASNQNANVGWQANGYDTTGWVPAASRGLYGTPETPWGNQVAIPAAATPDTRVSLDTSSWMTPPVSGNIPSAVFRKPITLSTTKEIAWAQMAVTGDQIFTAYWNGEQVAFNSGLNNEWQTARSVNLNAVPGENVVAFSLTTPGNSVNGGVLATVRVGYTDGTTEQITTGSSFKTLVTAESAAPAGWNDIGFDDSAWANAKNFALYGYGVYARRVTVPELAAGGDILNFQNSKWIWTPEASTSTAPAEDRAFRKTITAPAGHTATKAQIIITADDSFKLWVDGKLLGQTEGAVNEWQSSKKFTVDLSSSKTVIAVRTTNGPGSPAGLLVTARVTYDDASTQVVTSDDSWKAVKVIPDGFQATDFDDSAWPAAAVQANYGSGAWGTGVKLPTDPPAAAPLLRKEFSVDGPIASAKIYVAAGGYANVSLNGSPINDEILSPGFTDYDDHAQYTVTDLTDQLHPGANALGLELGRGFYGMTNGNVWNWQNPPWHDEPVARAVLRIEYTDGTTKDVVTDDSWKLHDGPTVLDDLYGGETYDAGKVQTGFDTVGFPDASWVPASEVNGPKGTLMNQQQQPIRVTDRLPAESITEPVDGVYVVTFPRVLAGTVEFTAQGEAGTTIRAQYGEKLLDNGRPNFSNNGGFQNGFQTDRFILAGTGAPETWAGTFSYKGFQYIEVTGWPGDEAPPLSAFTAEELHTDAPETGSFESSDDIMNRTHRAVVDTLLNNIHSIPTDTPMFEKNGWTGDAAVGAEMFMMNLDTQNLFEKWIGDINDSRDENGAPLVIAPSSDQWGQWGVAPPWHSAYILIPWWLYQYGGDVQVLQKYYDGMKGYVDLEYGRSDDGVVPQSRLGDWVSPEASPAGGNAPEDVRVSATAYLYTMLTSMEKTATLLGKTADAASFAEHAAVVKDAFNATFLDTAAGYYRGNGDRGYRQTHNVLALEFGLAPDAETAERVAASLAADVVAKGDKLNTGSLGTKYLLPVLTDYGYEDLAYKVAVQTEYPSWGFMIENDATTMWEHWSLDARSRGHYFLGTVDDWFYHYAAGIRSSETTGYRDITIDPAVTDDLEWAKATTQSPFGPVSVDWKKTGDDLSLTTHVPVGSTAVVHLPAPSRWAVTEGGKALEDVAGVRAVEQSGDDVLVTVGSGDYSFEVDAAAGAVGTVLESIDAIQAQADQELADGGINQKQHTDLGALVTEARTDALAALATIGSGDSAATARELAEVLLDLDAVDTWLGGLDAADDTGAALQQAAEAARELTDSTISALLGIEATAVFDAPAHKPGTPGTITAAVENSGQTAIEKVTAELLGLGEEWTRDPEGAASVGDSLAGGASASAKLGFTVPIEQLPGDVPATVDYGYRFNGATVGITVPVTVTVDSPVTMTAVTIDPTSTTPGGSTTLTATVHNNGIAPAVGHLEVAVPDGWVVPLATADVVLAPGADATLTAPVFVPVGADHSPATATLTADFVFGGVTFASGNADLGVTLAPVPATNPGYDHVDLGDATSEQAHNLTASSKSGTNTEAGLTRRYANQTDDNSHFEFDTAVVPGQPFMIRAIETYDKAQTKKYEIFVDDVLVTERLFTHTGGLGTETYEILVPASFATDSTVRVRMQFGDDQSFYDPSIADVWTLPVPADTVAPQVVATADPAAPSRTTGWYTSSPVTVSIAAQDDRDGVVGIESAVGDGALAAYTQPIVLDDDGQHVVRFRATDAAGNASASQTLPVKIDTVAPATTATLGEEFDGDTAATSGTVSFTAADATSGVASTSYRVDGGEWQQGGSVTVSEPGDFTVDYFSTDVAGNAEAAKTVTGTIVIPDVIAPTVSGSISAQGENGWYLEGAAVTITAEDSDSGVATIEYRLGDGDWSRYGSPVVLPEGESTIAFRATDNEGNVSAISSLSAEVDATAPTAWGWLSNGGRVTAVGGDSGSGIDHLQYSLDGETWVTGLTELIAEDAAPTTVRVQAIDRAGNTGEISALTRADAPQELTVTPGTPVLIESSGFEPGQSVRVELHSEPVVLTTVRADARGVIAAFAAIPGDVTPGGHTLVLVVDTDGGDPGDPGDPGTPGDGGNPGDGGEPGDGGQGGGSIEIPTTIASTGVNPLPWAILGGVLLLGGAWFALRRRRSTVITR